MVFIVVGNDFDESLAVYKTGPGFHHFVEGSDGSLELKLYEYSPTSFRKLIRRSVLARYLVFNLHAETKLRAFVEAFKKSGRTEVALNSENPEQGDVVGRPQFVGNTSSVANEERVENSIRAVDGFLAALPNYSGLPPERVGFIVDGVRPQLYGGPAILESVRDSYFSIMRREFMVRARARGHEVIDMNDAFMADYRQRGIRFEFENDSHWNAEGHKVAASVIENSAVYAAVFNK
jgi:hypothetical protein